MADHDTERNGASLAYNSTSNTYVLAHVFMLGYPYGTPTVLSSYEFESYDQGSPNNGTGTCSGTGGTNGWLCQHRWAAIAAMATFRNIVGSGPINNWQTGSSNQIAFGRGNLGFVAINNGDFPWSATFVTSLPAGQYCDVLTGPAVEGTICSGSSFIVSSKGGFSASIPPNDAIALHSGALGASTSIAVSFAENVTTVWGTNIFVTGNLTQLGSWSPDESVALSPATYPIWTVSVPLPPNTAFQYKFIQIDSSGNVVWESDPNRSDMTPASGSQALNDSWR